MTRPVTPHRRAPAWDEPRVTIDGERLKALIDADDRWTIPTLAAEMRRRKKAGASRSTLNYICTQRNKTCRAPLRRELALELGVPEAWLGGDMERLPLPWRRWGYIDADGHPITLAQAAAAAQAIGGIIHVTEELQRPPADQIAEQRFLSACVDRLKTSPHRNTDEAFATLHELISPANWRGLITSYTDLEREEETDAVIALTKAFTIILAPWFTGKVEINETLFDNFAALADRMGAALTRSVIESARSRQPSIKKGATPQ